jgi:hypothetical protein
MELPLWIVSLRLSHTSIICSLCQAPTPLVPSTWALLGRCSTSRLVQASTDQVDLMEVSEKPWMYCCHASSNCQDDELAALLFFMHHRLFSLCGHGRQSWSCEDGFEEHVCQHRGSDPIREEHAERVGREIRDQISCGGQDR